MVNFAFCLEGLLAPAKGVSEDQQAFHSLGNPPDVVQYQGSQVSETEVHKKPEDTDHLLNSSAETIPNIPKTPDT